MSTDFGVALEKKLTRKQRVERVFTPRQVGEAFAETFELIGGIPRLAIWANDPENYGQFLRLLMTVAPRPAAQRLEEANRNITYISAVPQSPLNCIEVAVANCIEGEGQVDEACQEQVPAASSGDGVSRQE